MAGAQGPQRYLHCILRQRAVGSGRWSGYQRMVRDLFHGGVAGAPIRVDGCCRVLSRRNRSETRRRLRCHASPCRVHTRGRFPHVRVRILQVLTTRDRQRPPETARDRHAFPKPWARIGKALEKRKSGTLVLGKNDAAQSVGDPQHIVRDGVNAQGADGNVGVEVVEVQLRRVDARVVGGS